MVRLIYNKLGGVIMDYYEEELRTAYDLIERKNSCLQWQNEKLEELRRENEELKLKVEEYYESWQDELMQRDDYEDI